VQTWTLRGGTRRPRVQQAAPDSGWTGNGLQGGEQRHEPEQRSRPRGLSSSTAPLWSAINKRADEPVDRRQSGQGPRAETNLQSRACSCATRTSRRPASFQWDPGGQPPRAAQRLHLGGPRGASSSPTTWKDGSTKIGDGNRLSTGTRAAGGGRIRSRSRRANPASLVGTATPDGSRPP